MNRIEASVSVVIPVYNSENTLNELTEQLENVLIYFDKYEIIFIDDASFDKSFNIIKKIADDNKNITGITLEKNSGQQSAILCGLRHAKYDYTVIIDDDLEQNPHDIILLYKKINAGYDVVYAILENRKLFNAGSFMRDILFRLMTRIPKGIKVSSYRILNNPTKNQIINVNTRFVYISMEILKTTTNIGNVKAQRGPEAKSNYSINKLIKLYYCIISTYSNKKIFYKNKIVAPCYEIKEIYKGKYDPADAFIMRREI